MFDYMTENQLREKATQLRGIANEFEMEAHKRFLARMRLTYNCECVALNADLGISTMTEQAENRRAGLTMGWVASALSADKDCPKCHGEGSVADALIAAARSETPPEGAEQRCVDAVTDAMEGRR